MRTIQMHHPDEDLRRSLLEMETIVASAVCDEYVDPSSWSKEHVSAAHEELIKLSTPVQLDLSTGKKIDQTPSYMSPAMGRVYASWYHVRRVYSAFDVLSLAAGAIKADPLRVLDVGCGTGAMTWALSFLNRRIEYVGVDSSEPMIKWAQLLWNRYNEKSPRRSAVSASFITADIFDLNVSKLLRNQHFHWLTLSFPFDDRNTPQLCEDSTVLQRLVSEFRINDVLCLWANNKNYGNHVACVLAQLGFDANGLCSSSKQKGERISVELTDARTKINETLGTKLDGAVFAHRADYAGFHARFRAAT